LLKRLMGTFGRRGGPVDPEPVIPGGKDGGHGDHWGCVLHAIHESKLVRYLVDVTKADGNPERFGLAGKGLAFRSEPGPVRTVVLVAEGILASAYPEVQDGPRWPIKVSEIIPWSNGMEAQIAGSCYGAEVRFFDTRYYTNKHRYRVGETYDFGMGALAYTLGRAVDKEAESDVGAKVSFKGAAAYMPAGTSDEHADIDDYWCHSPLEGEPVRAALAGNKLTGYPLIMAIPQDFEMRVKVFAAEHALAPDMAAVQIEDDLEGFLWLHGYLAEEE
jgi:hypothetical protein